MEFGGGSRTLFWGKRVMLIFGALLAGVQYL